MTNVPIKYKGAQVMHYTKNLESLNPDLTPEGMAQVDEIIERHKNKLGSLIPVLEECQPVVGYLPVELQEYIAKRLNIPGSNVYGVVTFYSFFSMIPKGRHIVKCCLGTACYVRGIEEVISRIQTTFNLKVGSTSEDRRFTLEAVRCLGACGLAPVVVVDSDTHGGVTADKISKIINAYE
jgi:NADH:ubiquinone oxidoreductase subunit E